MLEPDRLIAPAPASKEEEALERALRPQRLSEYVGQARAREQLEIFITAAKARKAAKAGAKATPAKAAKPKTKA